MVSKASELLPEPDRPVMTIRLSLGRSMSTPLRLCSRAPRTLILVRLMGPVCSRFVRAFQGGAVGSGQDGGGDAVRQGGIVLLPFALSLSKGRSFYLAFAERRTTLRQAQGE